TNRQPRAWRSQIRAMLPRMGPSFPVSWGLVLVALAVGCGGKVVIDSAGAGGSGFPGSGNGGKCGEGAPGGQSTAAGQPGDPPDIACEVTGACAEYWNVTAAERKAFRRACRDGHGTVRNVCPTAGLRGCCMVVQAGTHAGTCYYTSSADTLQSA